MSEFILREIAASDGPMMEKIGELRVRAWATETPDAAKMGVWIDEVDQHSRHWVIMHRNVPVAAARMSVHLRIDDVPEAEVYMAVIKSPLPSPIASINRLVVDPEYRGKGLAPQLDLIRVEEAERTGCRCIVGETPSGAKRIKQLESIGFSVVGSSLLDHPIFRVARPSAVLICHLPRSKLSS